MHYRESNNQQSPLIIALDTPDLNAAKNLVKQTQHATNLYKIGLELFIAHGPEAVRQIKDLGTEIFLDLKLHDIPHTVQQAVFQAAQHGVKFLTVHGMGGSQMLSAAGHQNKGPKLLAVSVLTHHTDDELRAIGFRESAKDLTIRLIKLAKESQIGGCICSPQEAEFVRENLGDDFVIVCPGVRPRGSDKNDQSRIATPKEAISNGANYIVVGRPIAQADDPGAAADAIMREIQ